MKEGLKLVLLFDRAGEKKKKKITKKKKTKKHFSYGFLFHLGSTFFNSASTPNKRNGDVVKQQQQAAVVRTAQGYF